VRLRGNAHGIWDGTVDAVWVPDGRISAAQSLQQDYRRNDWTSAATRASLLMTLGS
jgi:hypothetical protein